MTTAQYLALQRLARAMGATPWVDQPEPARLVPNRADRRRNRRNRRIKGAAR
ncbi:hypothetical protein AB0L22_08755 [Micromonospora haikouensis]|uniref:hypothetical protein n=1 Tax=Micromonospora haikouensis TaxID=686309 RepID=UPI00342B77F6